MQTIDWTTYICNTKDKVDLFNLLPNIVFGILLHISKSKFQSIEQKSRRISPRVNVQSTGIVLSLFFKFFCEAFPKNYTDTLHCSATWSNIADSGEKCLMKIVDLFKYCCNVLTNIIYNVVYTIATRSTTYLMRKVHLNGFLEQLSVWAMLDVVNSSVVKLRNTYFQVQLEYTMNCLSIEDHKFKSSKS